MTTDSTTQPLAELNTLRELVETALEKYLQPTDGCPERLLDAMRYSVLAPGKRLRPILCLLASQAVGGSVDDALPCACAVEFIHVYSLIHDDLPAMDNDDLRRGKPTCHRQFDEATAILAGDSLQMLAIETVAANLPADRALKAIQILSQAAGREALVGGQMDDLSAEGRFGPISPSEPLNFLQEIHLRKTSALIETSLHIGGVAGGATPQQLDGLRKYGRSIGLAFQIVDDCLDVESTPEQMGKATRKDSEAGKMTYPNLLGLEQSRQLANDLIADACLSLTGFNSHAKTLADIARFVVERRN